MPTDSPVFTAFAHSVYGGHGTAYTVNPTTPIVRYLTGYTIKFTTDTSNVGPSFLDVSTCGSVTIKKDGADLAAGDIPINTDITATYNGTYFAMSVETPAPTTGSGASGTSGKSGTSGTSGTSGKSGFSGTSGTSGFSGKSGTSGSPGASGTSGASGTNGSIGVDGASGASGVSGASGTTNVNIGVPTDGDYSDGLYQFVANTTTIADAIDMLNEALQPLAPPPAPDFSNYNSNQSGVTGKLSFDISNAIIGVTSVTGIGNLTAATIDQSFTNGALSGKRVGIFSSAQASFTGILAQGTAADTGSPNPSYPANAFGDGDDGILSIYVNNSVTPKVSVDLSSFGSGSSLNGQGTGFTGLSASTAVVFPNGTSFAVFFYRTGSWVAAGSDLIEGWNYIRVTHTVNAVERPLTALYLDFLRDLNTTATAFSSESLTGFVGSGLKTLSGVKYFTGGSANYALTIDNLYRNTYSASASALSYGFNGTALQTIAAEALAASSGDPAKQVVLAKTANITTSGIRILNASITVKTTALRTVQSTGISTGASVNNILVDNVAASSTITSEGFDDEVYRLPSNSDFDNSATAATSSWTTTESLVDSGTAGYNNGPQCYNSTLIYPVTNFASITNGPSSNVNYSTGVTGARTYYRFFDMTPTARSNFTITVSGTATPIASGTGFTNSTNQIKVDIKLPNGSAEGTGWMDVTQLFATATWTDGSGALNSGSFSMNSAMSITVGTKSTGSVSINGKVFTRIRVPQGWTGNLTAVSLVGA